MQTRTLERLTLNKRLLMGSFSWFRYPVTQHLFIGSSKYKNHYELLELQRDCTQSDIKEAFFRLSKELHPDKNPDSTKYHQQFISLNEAYSVLSKPHLRLAYDADLAYQERPNMRQYGGIMTDAPQQKVVFKDDTLWEMRDTREDHKYEGRPYYGIRGINKKLPNSYIAAGAFLFMIIGTIIHFFIALKSSDYAIEQLNQRDQIASNYHRLAREQAHMNGNKQQMLMLRQKTEAGSPTGQDPGRDNTGEPHQSCVSQY